MADTHASAQHELEHDEHAHPGYMTYLLIAAVLTILTAAEVAVFYVEALAPLLLPILMVLMVAKFALVVMFYMHLKFDDRTFSAVFIAPLVLAMAVVASLIIFFQVLPEYYPLEYIFQ